MSDLKTRGRGSICALPHILRLDEKEAKVLLFARETTLQRHPQVEEMLEKRVQLHIYPHIEPNPKYEDVQKAIEELDGREFDYIVAWGGGSVIDFAKAFRYYGNCATPLIAIPTTAGTGSEATQFAVIYKEGVKQSIDDASLLPDGFILDSQFCEKAPRALKASCAMDAYCQAIESYWAKRATTESRSYALRALELCRSCMVQAVNTSDSAANEQMLEAAHWAGKAINISRTTAAHALSYKMTSDYGIPHGHAVALCMPGLFDLNMEALDDPQPLLTALGVSQGAFAEHFRGLMHSIGLETDIEKLHISDIDTIVDAVNQHRLANNPRTLSEEDLRSILITRKQ